MSTTVLIEPDPGGHRFEAVANVAAVAAQTGPVVLLTSVGAPESEEFGIHLADAPVEVRTPFAVRRPPTDALAAAAAEICGERAVDTLVVMDGDEALKRWWLVAARAFARSGRPRRVVFMLTRYPTRVPWGDWRSWRKRAPKAVLVVAARGTRTLHRAAGFAGRDDLKPGWIVKRARDPAVCRSHARDRAQLRAMLDLPQDRRLVGVFGGVNDRKNVPMIWEAMAHAGIDADLLLAGPFDDAVRDWVAALPPQDRARVHARDGFWDNDVLDRYVAAADAVPLVIENNGPSGIMGKAWAAGVPVVTAGALVRAREVEVTGGGVASDFDVASIGAAIAEILTWDLDRVQSSTAPPATAEAFARTLLGVDDDGRASGRRTSRTRPV